MVSAAIVLSEGKDGKIAPLSTREMGKSVLGFNWDKLNKFSGSGSGLNRERSNFK